MSTVLKKIEYLKSIFKNVNLNIRSKITDEIEDMFSQSNEYPELHRELSENDYTITLRILEAALRDAKKDLKDAKKDVKSGGMTSNELIPYKLNVDELIQQIKEIKSRFDDK